MCVSGGSEGSIEIDCTTLCPVHRLTTVAQVDQKGSGDGTLALRRLPMATVSVNRSALPLIMLSVVAKMCQLSTRG